jgi:hypothetical protein
MPSSRADGLPVVHRARLLTALASLYPLPNGPSPPVPGVGLLALLRGPPPLHTSSVVQMFGLV